MVAKIRRADVIDWPATEENVSESFLSTLLTFWLPAAVILLSFACDAPFNFCNSLATKPLATVSEAFMKNQQDEKGQEILIEQKRNEVIFLDIYIKKL